MEINISRYDRVKVLVAFYIFAHPKSLFDYNNILTYNEAKTLLETQTLFTELKGKTLNLDLTDSVVNLEHYKKAFGDKKSADEAVNKALSFLQNWK